MIFFGLLLGVLALCVAVFYVGVCRPADFAVARAFWVLMACVVAATAVLVVELLVNDQLYHAVFGGWG